MYKNKKQSGSVLVELAIILPVALFITLTTFEVSRAIQRVSTAATLSRELANIATRECDYADVACLERVRTNLQIYADSIVSGTELIISSLEYTGSSWKKRTAEPAHASALITQTSQVGSLMFDMESNAGGNPDGIVNLDKLENVYLAECYIRYSPLLRFTLGFGIFPISGNYLYDATVM